MECEKCEFWNGYQEECGAFDCNGIECAELPCEKWWVFTFGWGQPHAGKYVKIRGTYVQARNKMFAKYGSEWAFQRSMEEWEKAENDPNRGYTIETELEVIE